MIGTTLNVVGILAGGIAGSVKRWSLSSAAETNVKIGLGAFTVYYGLRLTWLSVNGTLLQVLKQILIAVLAMVAGKAAGRLMRLQTFSNRLGRNARGQISAAKPDAPGKLGTGFQVCAGLFCAAPLGIIGAVQDGLSDYFYPLAVKAVMDGLAAMGLVGLFGRGVLLSALPVLAIQGTLSLASAQFLRPFLESRELLDSVNAAGGLMVFSVALVILGLKKIEMADYLPSLAFAPLITWLWR